MVVPAPGTAEAKERDCTCPENDNRDGAGLKDGQIFAVDKDCPLHGFKTE